MQIRYDAGIRYARPPFFLCRSQGRGQETPGEDPVLNGRYGASFIAGFQGDTIAPANGTAPPPPPLGRLKSSSCAKHFFAYSLENCFTLGDNCRLNFDAELTQQEIEDTYLPAFQSAVELGRVSGLMCSYNAVNGTALSGSIFHRCDRFELDLRGHTPP